MTKRWAFEVVGTRPSVLPQIQSVDVETAIVQITRTGTRTVITEIQTGRQHSFELITTSYPRDNAPTQRQQTHVDNEFAFLNDSILTGICI